MTNINVILVNLQAFVVAGGKSGSHTVASVLALLLGATAWKSLASLPQALCGVRASVMGNRLRLTGGHNGDSYQSKVHISKMLWF